MQQNVGEKHLGDNSYFSPLMLYPNASPSLHDKLTVPKKTGFFDRIKNAIGSRSPFIGQDEAFGYKTSRF
jgi:hypothetical protein